MKWISALVAALLVLATTLPSIAATFSPEGMWEIEFRDSRYEVTLCGDGTQLCGKLVWLGNGADNAENMPYLNTYLIDHAKMLGPNYWEGELHIFGQTASGKINLVSDDEFVTEGCVLLIICKTIKFYRID